MKRQCKFCGSAEELRRIKKRFLACRKCRPAVYAVINQSNIVEQVWPLFNDHAIVPIGRQIRIPWKSDIPEILDAQRYKVKDRDQLTWYVVASEYNGCPVELFTSTAEDTNYDLQSRIATLSALTRLISLMLRHVFLGEQITVRKIKDQLKRSSRNKKDLPDILLTILEKYRHPRFNAEPNQATHHEGQA